MRNINQLLFIAILVFGLQSCSNSLDDQNLESLEYLELLNISYGTNPDQTFDLYLPANRTTDTKVMILVHGGGWIEGDKDDLKDIKDRLRTDLPNIAIANINYRLASPNNPPFPMQIDDITAVVDLLKANKDSYVISNDIGFLGTSAGAQLSLLWSYAHDDDKDVKMVASIVAPTNFTDPAYLESNNPLLLLFIGSFGINTSEAYLESISPYHRATSTSPPTILFNGGSDPLIPTSQGIDMDAKLDELGVTHSFTLYPDEGHGWEGDALLDTWITLKSFIQVHLD